MKHNGFTLSFNSKVLAASGTCAAGLLLLSCAPVMAAENPVQPAETETAVPAAQAGDTTELPVDETQPAAVSATVSQSGQTEAVRKVPSRQVRVCWILRLIPSVSQ